MGKIELNGIRLRAYHGCLKEEAIIGGEYIVNVEINVDFSKAETTDELQDTIDYCCVYEIVKKEMAIRSKLVEHVAKRIITNLRETFPSVHHVLVRVTKINPPMNGDIRDVTVEISY